MYVMILLLYVLVLPTAAEQRLLEQLIKAKSLKCQFSEGVSADWKDGTLNLNREKDAFGSSLHFDSIDFKSNKARFIGNSGASNVTANLTEEAVTFIEETTSGNLIFTSVFPEYKKGTREFIAVTSRHIMLWGGPLPSQYHGTCQVWK